MTIYLILGLSGLIIFGCGVYCPARSMYATYLLPGWIIVSSWIVSLLLYSYSVINLFPPLESIVPIVRFFSIGGAVFLFLFVGWLGHFVAEDLNRSDYIRQVRNIEGQIKDIKANKAP